MQHLPLLRLVGGDTQALARSVCCHQAVASDACFAAAMLADLGTALGLRRQTAVPAAAAAAVAASQAEGVTSTTSIDAASSASRPLAAGAGYASVHWEAGVLGQALYLEAEALGLSATGLGCFFDDAVNRLVNVTHESDAAAAACVAASLMEPSENNFTAAESSSAEFENHFQAVYCFAVGKGGAVDPRLTAQPAYDDDACE